MSEDRFAFGGVVFTDMPELSANEAMFWEDMLDIARGGGMSKDMVDPSDGGVTEDLLGLPTNSFLGGDSSVSLNGRDSSSNAATPGIPVQPSPSVGYISQPCSPPDSCTELSNKYAEGILTNVEIQPKPYAQVSILKPPMDIDSLEEWIDAIDSMLPNDILRKALRKRAEGKYFNSGQKYKPCTWEKFIERVNQKISAGKLKVIAKRSRRSRRRQIRNPEEVTDPVIVALQAQAEIYEEHFNAVTLWKWD